MGWGIRTMAWICENTLRRIVSGVVSRVSSTPSPTRASYCRCGDSRMASRRGVGQSHLRALPRLQGRRRLRRDGRSQKVSPDGVHSVEALCEVPRREQDEAFGGARFRKEPSGGDLLREVACGRRGRGVPTAQRRAPAQRLVERYHPLMNDRDLILLESAMTAIDEATSAVAREVERDRLGESSLARLSTVEAELRRSRLALEKIVQEEAR